MMNFGGGAVSLQPRLVASSVPDARDVTRATHHIVSHYTPVNMKDWEATPTPVPATPTPTPRPAPVAVVHLAARVSGSGTGCGGGLPADVAADIVAAASQYGADACQLERVATCESHGNPYAHNPSGATGVFQFMPGTWAANAPGQNIYDPKAQADTAARMFAHGQAHQWSCK